MQVPAGQSVFNGVEGYSAVRLFLQSANRTQSDFSLHDRDKPVIARICELVDGVPLGIELAAAWVRILSLHEIAIEIERSLDFLTTTQRNIPERHRSLRAVFEHSWHMLSNQERAVYCRLTVFQGGFDRTAGETIAGADLITLSSLVDKSLVYRKGSGRYELHQILKQYAQEKWLERDEVERCHCHYFAAFVDRLRWPHGDKHQQTFQIDDYLAKRDAVYEEIDNMPYVNCNWRKSNDLSPGCPPFLRRRSGYKKAIVNSGWLPTGCGTPLANQAPMKQRSRPLKLC
jgi:predicted ATPase